MSLYQEKGYSYYRKAFDNCTFPLAFVDMDMLDTNIDALASRAGGKIVKIVTKSVRSVAITNYILKKRPDIYKGAMAYYPEEAIHLSECGIDDVIIAYPYCNEKQLAKLAGAIKKGAVIKLMVDHIIQAEKASAAAVKAGIEFEVCIDMDMSTKHPSLYFGVYRSPLKTADEVVNLAKSISKLPGLLITGLMGYEAQIAGQGDKIPGKTMQNIMVKNLRRLSFFQLTRRRKAAYNALIQAGFKIKHVYGGGTGSMELTKTEDSLTEITIGSGFYSSGIFDYYSDFRHRPAAAFALEINRIPAPGMFTASGGGYIASGVTGKGKQPFPYLPADIKLVENEGFGEVQTPFFYNGKEKLGIGAPVFFRHSKAGELCERFNELHLVRDGKVVETVKTYRGEGLSFL